MAEIADLERRILDLEAQNHQGLELSQHHGPEHFGAGRDPAVSWITRVATSAEVPATSPVARLYEVVGPPLQLWLSDPDGKRQLGVTLEGRAALPLTLTGGFTTITGCTITLPAPGTWLVHADILLDPDETEDGQEVIAQLVLNLTVQTGNARQTISNDVARESQPFSHSWVVTNTAANDVLTLQAQKEGGAGASRIQATHTVLVASSFLGGGSEGVASALHNLLSATHPDTLAGGVARGAIPVGNATPKWAALGLGTLGTYVRSDSVDTTFSGIKMNDVLGQHVYFGDPRSELTDFGAGADAKTVYGPLELLVDISAKSCWIKVRLPGAGSQGAKAVIYADSTGVPGALVAVSNEVIISNTVQQWTEFVFATPPALSAQSSYWLGIHTSATSSIRILVSSQTFGGTVGLRLHSVSDTYSDGPSDPFGSPGASVGRVMSCYVEGLQYTDAMARAAVPYQVVIPMLIEPVVF